MKIVSLLALLLLVPVLMACSSAEEEILEAVESRQTDEEMYDEAGDLFAERRYIESAEKFLEIEQQYPFSPLATRGKVMAAYSYYRDTEYADALGVIDSFVRLHPSNENVAYMYYLKAMSFYERIADVERDQDVTQKALDALEEIVTRFPATGYARDARLKLDLVRDHLAGKQMAIGRFYIKRKQTIAAINRFKNVVQDYQTTSHVPEALYRLTELYLTLGAEHEAQKYSAVLGHNYPSSRWYEYAYRLVAGGAESPLPQEKSSGSGFWFWSYDTEDEGDSEALPPPDEELTEPGFWEKIF